jgi:chromosome segregation ATPase
LQWPPETIIFGLSKVGIFAMPDHDNAYRQTMNQISALMDLMRPMINHVGHFTEALGRHDAEFNKIGRHFHDLRQNIIDVKSEIRLTKNELEALKSEFTSFKADISTRLDAIFIRLDEIESTGLRNETAIRNLASEMVLQHNTILNALQDSHNNKLALEQLDERLSELEREVRQLRRN